MSNRNCLNLFVCVHHTVSAGCDVYNMDTRSPGPPSPSLLEHTYIKQESPSHILMISTSEWQFTMTSIVKVYLFLELNKWTDVIRVKFLRFESPPPLPLSYSVLPTVQSSRHKTQKQDRGTVVRCHKIIFFFSPSKVGGSQSHRRVNTHGPVHHAMAGTLLTRCV